MRKSAAALAAVAALAACTFAAPSRCQASDFVRREGTHFICRDARFYYAGTNCYYLSYFAADYSAMPGVDPADESARRQTIDDLMDLYAEKGFNVIRVWAFNDGGWNNDGYPEHWAWQQHPEGDYNETALRGLDYVLEGARSRGIRLLLTFTNNWPDYGGMEWYFNHSDTATIHRDQFYIDEQCKQWYKARVWNVVNRRNTVNNRIYKDDPTIFAWELANEPRAESDSGCTQGLFNTWAAEMSAYIKSIAPNHMVSTGMEGFYNIPGRQSWMYNGYAGTDFIADHQLPNIDFCTGHLYPDPGHWNITPQQAIAWIQNHIYDARYTIGKPYILEEFGKKPPDIDQTLETWTNLLYNNAQAGGAAAGWNYWMLEAEESGHQDGYGLFYSDAIDRVTINMLAAQADAINSLTPPDADVDADGAIGFADLIIIRNNLRRTPGDDAPLRADVNRDSIIDLVDMVRVRNLLDSE